MMFTVFRVCARCSPTLLLSSRCSLAVVAPLIFYCVALMELRVACIRPDRFRFVMRCVWAISQEAALLNASLSRALHQRVYISIKSAQNSSDMCDYSISCFLGLEMDDLKFSAKDVVVGE